jgi:anti-anti-sigma factor
MSFTDVLTKNNDELIVKLSGEFDIEAANTVQAKLEEYDIKDINKVIFDLNDVTFIASSGIRVFIIAKDCLKGDMDVDVINAKGRILNIIKMSGANCFINVVE